MSLNLRNSENPYWNVVFDFMIRNPDANTNKSKIVFESQIFIDLLLKHLINYGSFRQRFSRKLNNKIIEKFLRTITSEELKSLFDGIVKISGPEVTKVDLKLLVLVIAEGLDRKNTIGFNNRTQSVKNFINSLGTDPNTVTTGVINYIRDSILT